MKENRRTSKKQIRKSKKTERKLIGKSKETKEDQRKCKK